MCWVRRYVRAVRGAVWCRVVERRARARLVKRRERRRSRLGDGGGWRMEGRKNLVSGRAEMMCSGGRSG